MSIIQEQDCGTFKVQLVDLREPTVTFVDGPRNPLGTIAKLSRGYKGIYSNSTPSDEEIKNAIDDINDTKLQTPYEMMSFVFLIGDVTRSFTHQLVRTRVGASYVQESMRFIGHKGVYKVLASHKVKIRGSYDFYLKTVSDAIWAYEALLNLGVPGEDARDVLPHGIMTQVFVGYALSALVKVYSQRVCCQAQPGQWQIIAKKMKELLIEEYGDKISLAVSAPFERGEPCGYRASFDRPCSWQKDTQ